MQFYGQERVIYKGSKITSDTTYIRDLADKFIVKVFVDNKIDTYNYSFKDSGEFYELMPNVNSKISLSLDYEIIAFSVSVPKKWSPFQIDEELKGKTKDLSFAFGLFLNKWYQNFYFSDTKGYYIANTVNVQGWKQGIDPPYILLPNYRARKLEGTTSYIINGNKFSYRSFLYETQIQRKSAGSLIPSLAYSYLYQSDENQESKYEYKGNIFTFMCTMAYQYNWVLSRSFYLSGGLIIGGGIRNSHETQNIEDNKEKTVYNSFSNTLGFNANVNYQTGNLFAGLKTIVTGTTAKQDASSNINNTIAYGIAYLGYRFDAPHLISKTYNRIIK
jgi:hypothetical protein